MLKNNSVQLEMFKTDDEASGSQGVSRENSSHLKKIRGYQKSVYMLVAFIFVSLVSFSFGVEKGKKQVAGIMPMGMEPASLPKVESTSLAVEASPLPSKQGPVLLVNKNTIFPKDTDGLIRLTASKSAPLAKKQKKLIFRLSRIAKNLSRKITLFRWPVFLRVKM